MEALVKLGFIRLGRSGTRKYGFALMLHPVRVVASLRQKGNVRIPEWWISLYDQRMLEIGAPAAAAMDDGAA